MTIIESNEQMSILMGNVTERFEYKLEDGFYVKTEEASAFVLEESSFGTAQVDIAAELGICANTLRKHFKDELRRGRVKTCRNVAKSVYKSAMEGDGASQRYWLSKMNKEVWGDHIDAPQLNMQVNVMVNKPAPVSEEEWLRTRGERLGMELKEIEINKPIEIEANGHYQEEE